MTDSTYTPMTEQIYSLVTPNNDEPLKLTLTAPPSFFWPVVWQDESHKLVMDFRKDGTIHCQQFWNDTSTNQEMSSTTDDPVAAWRWFCVNQPFVCSKKDP